MTWSSHSWGWKLTGHTRQRVLLTWETTLEFHLTAALFGTFQVSLGFLGATRILGLICPRHLKCRQHRADGRSRPAIIDEGLSQNLSPGFKCSNIGITWEKRFLGSKHNNPSDDPESCNLLLASSSSARCLGCTAEKQEVLKWKRPQRPFHFWRKLVGQGHSGGHEDTTNYSPGLLTCGWVFVPTVPVARNIKPEI